MKKLTLLAAVALLAGCQLPQVFHPSQRGGVRELGSVPLLQRDALYFDEPSLSLRLHIEIKAGLPDSGSLLSWSHAVNPSNTIPQTIFFTSEPLVFKISLLLHH